MVEIRQLVNLGRSAVRLRGRGASKKLPQKLLGPDRGSDHLRLLRLGRECERRELNPHECYLTGT